MISYQRDVDGRVTGLVSTQTNQSTALAQGISYAPFGPLQSMTLGNGVQIQASHDQQYRLSSLEAGAVLKREYSYTLLSQVAAISDELDASRSQCFVYDLSGRLSQAQGVYGVFSYSYDSNGNRLSKTEDGLSTSYQYGTTNNRLLGVGNGPTLSYDAKGRLTEEGERNYSWNEDDRLSAISENNATTLGQYGYDIRGLRRSAVRASGTNLFVYDNDGNLLAETDVNGVILREYVYLDDQRLALFDLTNSDATFYYIGDHLGTAQILLDNHGVVVWQGNYKPFGEVDVVVNNLEQYFRFPGQIFDIESGLHYNWNRYYNPEIGRYISADPIGLDGGLNLYAYVGNDPVNWVDPWGLCRCGNPADVVSDALSNVGSTDWSYYKKKGRFNRNTNKCNLFVEDMLTQNGFDVPDMNGWFSYNGPTAGQWGDPNVDIPGYPVVTNPKPGDIIAIPHNYVDATGHVGIVTGHKSTASQSSQTDRVENNDWGFRPGQSPVYRRCQCP